jgi:hypothetical protein
MDSKNLPETIKKYYVVEGDTVHASYNNQAPATTLAKQIRSKGIVEVIEVSYDMVDFQVVRKVINGNIFNATAD